MPRGRGVKPLRAGWREKCVSERGIGALYEKANLYPFLLIAEAAGEVDGDGGTLALFGLERDFAIHTIDDGFTDRQAQTGILIKHVERLIALKHV